MPLTNFSYILKLFTSNVDLRNRYNRQIETHNQQIRTKYPDAGFDLFCPKDIVFNIGEKKLLGLELHGAMTYNDNPCSYFMYPRSSISKTPLRLMNSVGIIDSGYRGELKEALHHVELNNNETYTIQEGQRLAQICAPTLSPFQVELVDNLSDLGITDRGDGGFGSTGI